MIHKQKLGQADARIFEPHAAQMRAFALTSASFQKI